MPLFSKFFRINKFSISLLNLTLRTEYCVYFWHKKVSSFFTELYQIFCCYYIPSQVGINIKLNGEWNFVSEIRSCILETKSSISCRFSISYLYRENKTSKIDVDRKFLFSQLLSWVYSFVQLRRFDKLWNELRVLIK